MKVPFFPSEKYGHWLATAGASVLFVFMGLGLYLDAGRDDTFITLWAGENLAAGHGLVNYNFERVEISSSLLHTLIVAAIVRVCPGYLFTLNKLACLSAGVLTLVLIGRYWKVLFPWREYRFAALCCVQVSLATMPSFLYWTLGGLETPFVTLILLMNAVGFVLCWTRRTMKNELRLLVAQVLFMLVRPEAFYIIPFTLIFTGLYAWSFGWHWRLCRLLLVPPAFFLALGLFRLGHFGTFFPNPVYAKTNGLFRDSGHGLHYVLEFYSSSPFHLFLGIAALAVVCYFGVLLCRSLAGENLLKTRAEGPLIFVLGLMVTAHLIVVLTGGDWMEHHRFMHPPMPLVVILAIGFSFRFIRWTGTELFPKFATPGACRLMTLFMAALLMMFWVLQLGQKTKVTSWQGNIEVEVDRTPTEYSLRELWEDEGGLDEKVKDLCYRYKLVKDALMPFLEGAFQDLYRQCGKLVIATPQMGWFPYFLKKRYPEYDLYFIDTHGLCDQGVALLGMPGSAYGLAAGNRILQILSGNAGPLSEYVLAKKPNIFYRLTLRPQVIPRVENLGYKAVFTEPGAFIFYKAWDQ